MITFVVARVRITLDRLYGDVDRPTISLGSLSAPDSGTTLVPDQSAGIAAAVRHLFRLGHRRIGYLGYPTEFPDSVLRYESYRAAMNDAGLFDECLVAPSVRQVDQRNTLPVMTSAIVGKIGRPYGAGVLPRCDRHGRNPCALEGMGAARPHAMSASPASTTLFHRLSSASLPPLVPYRHFDRVEMGCRAVQIIEGELRASINFREVFPVSFEARDSTALHVGQLHKHCPPT